MVTPAQQIFEGDDLTIECTISSLENYSGNTSLELSQGTRFLGRGVSRVSRRTRVLFQEMEEFECGLKTGNVVKRVTKRVNVTGEWAELRRFT